MIRGKTNGCGKSVRDDSGNQPSARLYFANRAAKGFTVIPTAPCGW